MTIVFRLVGRALGAWPSTGAAQALVAMAFVDAAGTGLYLSSGAIFFTRVVGLSVGQVGLGLAAAGATGLAATIPFGLLADRWGPRRTLALVHAWRAAGFAAYALVGSFPAFVLVACALAIPDRAAGPITGALVGAVAPGERVATRALMRAVRNLGFGLGALLAIVPLRAGTRVAFDAVVLTDAATFVAAAGLALSLRTAAERRPAAPHHPMAGALRDGRYLAVTALSAALAAHRSILTLGVPLVVAASVSAPPTIVPILLAVNIAASVLLQVRASQTSATLAGAAVTFRRAGFALTVCCVALAVAARAPWPAALAPLLLAVVGQTGAELWQSAAGWEVSYALAAPGREAVSLSVYGLAVAGETVYGPALVGAVMAWSATAGWLLLAVPLAGVGLLAPALVRWAAGDRWVREASARGGEAAT